MQSAEHLRAGERYLSAASHFTADPTGSDWMKAYPIKDPVTNQLLLDLANAHFAAATAAAIIEGRKPSP